MYSSLFFSLLFSNHHSSFTLSIFRLFHFYESPFFYFLFQFFILFILFQHSLFFFIYSFHFSLHPLLNSLSLSLIYLSSIFWNSFIPALFPYSPFAFLSILSLLHNSSFILIFLFLSESILYTPDSFFLSFLL